jgi:sec-independent protein translocase protein TatA
MPFHMGPMEIGIILVIVLIIFGVGKLPQVGGAIGKSIREFRKEKDGIEDKAESKDIAQSSETKEKKE